MASSKKSDEAKDRKKKEDEETEIKKSWAEKKMKKTISSYDKGKRND